MSTYNDSVAESGAAADDPVTLRWLAPTADYAVGDWTNPGGGDLFPAIAEAVPDQATFIKSGTVGGTANAYVTLIATGKPGIVVYEMSALGAPLDGTVNIYCGATPVASYSQNQARGSKTRYRQVLTPEQSALITDPAGVRVEFVRATNVFAVVVVESVSLAAGTGVVEDEQHDPVWITLPAVLPFIQGQPDSISLSPQYVSDPDSDPLTFTLESGSLPDGVTFNPVDCTIVYDGSDVGAEIGAPIEASGIAFGADDNAPGNFAARRNSPNVVRWHKFDQGTSTADFDSDPIVGQGSLGPEWVSQGATTDSYWFYHSTDTLWTCELDWPGKYADSVPTLTSGTACLRLARPSMSDEGSPKFEWFFGHPRNSVTFGAGQKFYIQWRQRYNQAYIDYVANDGDQTGIKQAFILAGINPGTGLDIGNHDDDSMQIVLQTYNQFRVPILMTDWTGYQSGNIGGSCGLIATTDYGPQEAWQNARPVGRDVTTLTGATCTHNLGVNYPYPPPGGPPGCFLMVADEWLTYKILVDLTDCDPETQPELWNPSPPAPADEVRYRWAGSKLKLWAGREGQPLELVIDWRPGVPGYFALDAGNRDDLTFGKVHLAQQETSIIPEAHDPLITWYDELIVSTEDIPDPL